jgi:hypothetical protein
MLEVVASNPKVNSPPRASLHWPFKSPDLQRAPLPSSSRQPASPYSPVGILLCGSLLHFDSLGQSSHSLGWRFLLRDFPSICPAFRFTGLRLLRRDFSFARFKVLTEGFIIDLVSSYSASICSFKSARLILMETFKLLIYIFAARWV